MNKKYYVISILILVLISFLGFRFFSTKETEQGTHRAAVNRNVTILTTSPVKFYQNFSLDEFLQIRDPALSREVTDEFLNLDEKEAIHHATLLHRMITGEDVSRLLDMWKSSRTPLPLKNKIHDLLYDLNSPNALDFIGTVVGDDLEFHQSTNPANEYFQWFMKSLAWSGEIQYVKLVLNRFDQYEKVGNPELFLGLYGPSISHMTQEEVIPILIDAASGRLPEVTQERTKHLLLSHLEGIKDEDARIQSFLDEIKSDPKNSLNQWLQQNFVKEPTTP